MAESEYRREGEDCPRGTRGSSILDFETPSVSCCAVAGPRRGGLVSGRQLQQGGARLDARPSRACGPHLTGPARPRNTLPPHTHALPTWPAARHPAPPGS